MVINFQPRHGSEREDGDGGEKIARNNWVHGLKLWLLTDLEQLIPSHVM